MERAVEAMEIAAAAKKARLRKRGPTLLERAVIAVGLAFLAFSFVTFILYVRLSDDVDFIDVVRAVRLWHRSAARSVRGGVTSLLGGGEKTPPLAGGEKNQELRKEAGGRAGPTEWILPRPTFLRFTPLPQGVGRSIFPPAGDVEIPLRPGRPDAAYVSGPPLKFKPLPPSKPKVPKPSGGGAGQPPGGAGAGAAAGAPELPIPERPKGMGGTAFANMVRGSTFYLDPERVDELRKMPLDIALSKIHLEMRGRITCGGKPIMMYNDMDEVAELPGLAEVLPETDELRDKKLGSCAVVGNSGVLLDAEAGEEIDGYDTVIRFNGAPTKNYEQHVGSKTTIRIQNVDHLGFREKTDQMLIFTARNPKDMKKFNTHRRKYTTRKQYVFNPEFWCHVWDWVSHRKLKPTSGMAGGVLAMHLCDGPVDIYGFHHNSTAFHYFNKLPEKVTTQEVYAYHPLWEEAALYRELEAMNLTRVH
mmetsp:Transcript_58557/g.186662  ORF Transcript_58557/g.186662 Transcript_58557/m.186662 type:complete len:474 (+) Transcript_58557:82-1503(+)